MTSGLLAPAGEFQSKFWWSCPSPLPVLVPVRDSYYLPLGPPNFLSQEAEQQETMIALTLKGRRSGLEGLQVASTQVGKCTPVTGAAPMVWAGARTQAKWWSGQLSLEHHLLEERVELTDNLEGSPSKQRSLGPGHLPKKDFLGDWALVILCVGSPNRGGGCCLGDLVPAAPGQSVASRKGQSGCVEKRSPSSCHG